MSGKPKPPRPITVDDLRGLPGLSRAAIAAIVEAQPATLRRALRIPGVGRKTAHRMLGRGLIAERAALPPAAPPRTARLPKPVESRREVWKLLKRIKAALPQLELLLARFNARHAYEDGVYRFYHGSFKVYGLQGVTEDAIAALHRLVPRRRLHPYFLKITKQGTRINFEREHNRRWVEVTSPMVEAFLHARYFVEMAIKYGKQLDKPPQPMPYGWAALLSLYRL